MKTVIPNDAMLTSWHGFTEGDWQTSIHVRDFMQKNYTPYRGDESFLTPASERTDRLMSKLNELFKRER